MEKYFTVTEESKLHKEWFDYKDNKKAVNELVNIFTSENGIEAEEYYADNGAFYIVPSEKDTDTFLNLLGSPHDNGLRKFKSTSKIGKAWIKALKDADLKIMQRPMAILYFKSVGGKFRSRMFDQNGILYCSLEPVHGENPVGFVEMKASEFFRIVEESENVPA